MIEQFEDCCCLTDREEVGIHSPPPRMSDEAFTKLEDLEFSSILSSKMSPAMSPQQIISNKPTAIRINEFSPVGRELSPTSTMVKPPCLNDRRSDFKREKTQSLMRNIEKVEWTIRQSHNVESIKLQQVEYRDRGDSLQRKSHQNSFYEQSNLHASKIDSRSK